MTTMSQPRHLTFLVLGATGGTGKHFVARALQDGHSVRALARTPSKLSPAANLEIVQGSITDSLDTDALVSGVDIVVSMLGDQQAQRTAKINTAAIKLLVPSMRKAGVKRLLYQSGAMTAPYGAKQNTVLWLMRKTLGSSYDGQHRDNEGVAEYLVTEAMDIEWIVHRAGIGGDGPSKGVLARSQGWPSVGTFRDCAEYNYRTVMDPAGAVHTQDLSQYQ